MRTKTKVWLIIAASLVLIGCILFAGVMTTLGWDFTKLATVKYETNTYEISEAFDGIFVNTDTADIHFAPSDNEICKVICYEPDNAKHSVIIQDGTLTIDVVAKKEWYDYIGVNFGSPKITVYLPKAEYASLFIKGSTADVEIPKDFNFKSVDISLSTGDISIENISADNLDLTVSTGNVTVSNVICEGDTNIKVSTGKTKLTNIECKNFITSGSTGDISLKNVIAAEKLSIKRSTGDVIFDGSDAADIFVETDTGDVSGSLLTDKVFITQTDTGRVELPKTTTGGKCEINTDTGDIKITTN